MQDATDNYAKSSKSFARPLIALIAILAIGGIIAVYNFRKSSQAQVDSNAISNIPEIKTVTALGRLEPEGEVIKLSAPVSAEGSRVDQLLVKEGDQVKTGQVVAILDSRDRFQASLEEAKEAVRVAQASLAQVKAGAKQGEIEAQKATIARLKAERSTEIDAQRANIARLETEQNTEIAAQKATIARLEAELKNARVEYQRNQTLYQQGAISESLRDSKRLTWETAQQQINEAKANLKRIQSSRQQQINEAKANLKRIQNSRQQQIKEGTANLNRIAEVRPVDVAAASAEVQRSVVAVKRAEANLQQAYVKSPQDGKVFEIFARPGELIPSDGVATIGQTSQMYAIAEVYESDIGKVKVGQQVKVTSNSFSGELQGTVEKIGLEVQRQEVINTDPASNIDAKVVEVKVLLDKESSQKVQGLTNLLVKVTITL
ncbi:MAG: ABC exporter membrane fusion protein [Calothrix sp. MO_167.B42]|nr:ABC exporter membrane fusion protein [Calothrix sp. MO_167.B42]